MSEPKPYKFPEDDEFGLTNMVREGVAFPYLSKLSAFIHFTIEEWAAYLHLSERTLQRYKKDKKAFDPIHSERIVQIELLYKKGMDVFGNGPNFHTWMETKSIPLGGVNPKALLDTAFGINMVKDELTRIEHGVLA
ncbi:MAG: DUF2384 domain-containing protein [Sphingobacteriaceae bacterium]|nr:MAG: DUF2384 domain-containing protein [Sphingobacteriaceae bacterium]